MTFLIALLAPYRFGQMFTGAKSVVDNPFIGSPRLNAMGLHTLRVRAQAMTAHRRAALASALLADDKAKFDRNGVVEIRDFLGEEQFHSLRAQVRAYRGPVRETVQGDTTTRRIAMDRQVKIAIPALAHFSIILSIIPAARPGEICCSVRSRTTSLPPIYPA